MTNNVNTIATRKITVYTTAHPQYKPISCFLQIIDRIESIRHVLHTFAADQIATIAVMEIMPADLLYTSSISEIRNGAMYSGITLSMILKASPLSRKYTVNRDEKP